MTSSRLLLVLSVSGIVARSSDGAGDTLEIGGHAGGTSTKTLRTEECAVPLDSTARCTYRSSADHASGLSLGAFVRYPILRAISLEANVLYAQKGYEDVRFHYLETPLVVRVSPFPEGTRARVFVVAGVAPALRVGCRASGVAFDTDLHEPYSYAGPCDDAPFPPTPSRFDLGGVVGAGAGWSFGFGIIELQVRLVRGLVDVGGHPDALETVNDAFYVLAGFGTTLSP